MSLRPLTSWSYAGAGDASRWASLDIRLGAAVESATKHQESLGRARQRWGVTRLACLTAGASWEVKPPPGAVGFGYTKVGAEAESGIIRSAWGLLERGAADAVWVRAAGAEFVIERTAESSIALLPGSSSSAGLRLDVDRGSAIEAVVVGAAIADMGLRCGPGGVEPERVLVHAGRDTWQLEVRL